MSQINKGDTFADGQQVTGARLNQLVDSATINTNFITDQSALTAKTITSNDNLIVYQQSSNSFKKIVPTDLIQSNLPVITSSITSGTNSDITITPNNGVSVTGVSYTSLDGLTSTITSNAHGLVTGQVITISSATNTAWNGTYRITYLSTNSFTVILTTATTSGTGTLNYIKNAVSRNTGTEVINGNIYVDGNSTFTGNALITGNLLTSGSITSTGVTTINGNVVENGSVTQNGAVIQNGSVTQNGTVNLTGVIQYNGIPVYGVSQINKYTKNYTYYGNNDFAEFNETFIKQLNDIWVIQCKIDAATSFSDDSQIIPTVRLTFAGTNYDNKVNLISVAEPNGNNVSSGTTGTSTWGAHLADPMALTWIIPAGVTLTGAIRLSYISNTENTITPNHWRFFSASAMITRYTTA
jgi:hypothetical protein